MLTAPRRSWLSALIACNGLVPIVVPIVASIGAPSELRAQSAPTARCVVTIRTVELRSVPLMETGGRDSTTSAFADNATCGWSEATRKVRVRPVLPWLRFTGAKGLPSSQEDGALWNGRGTSAAIRGGVAIDASFLHVAFVPEIALSTNAAFDHEPSRDSTRSSFASPFHSQFGGSLDLPKRFGSERYREVSAGASAVWLSAYGVSAGWSAAPQQWGPGQRGSLLLGAAAAGIPRAFLRSAKPIQTKLGVFDAVAFLGTVTESQFFDNDATNDFRSISAAGVSWSPEMASRLNVGIARGVMRASESAVPKAAHITDAFAAAGSNADELFSAFARLGRPDDALSGWVEVARNQPGFGLRSFLTLPYDAMSYVVGLRGAASTEHGRIVVLGEAANLEQGEDVKGREPRDFYTGQAAVQGWTQRGRPIGHWIGPGAQSQFISVDYVRTRARFGLFAERVRRDEDALFREYLAYPNRHDVSTEMGLRAAVVWRGQEISLDGSIGKRINFEFQNAEYLPALRTVDVSIPRIRFSITPMSQR